MDILRLGSFSPLSGLGARTLDEATFAGFLFGGDVGRGAAGGRVSVGLDESVGSGDAVACATVEVATGAFIATTMSPTKLRKHKPAQTAATLHFFLNNRMRAPSPVVPRARRDASMRKDATV